MSFESGDGAVIVQYNDSFQERWDRFVLNESANGCFLQTRNFLNYHPFDRFVDHSLVFFKGEMIAAVMPANREGSKLVSHRGSTFGGLIVGEAFASIANYDWMFEELMIYCEQEGLQEIEIRQPSWLFMRKDRRLEMLDYFFQLYGFSVRGEVGFFLRLDCEPDELETQYAQLKRRKLKKARGFGLTFRELTNSEIPLFYTILEGNMLKFNTKPVHKLEELQDFKERRLADIVRFYGVFHENEIIAGSMVFCFFDNKVFHTQYLASKQDKLEYCPNEFLYSGLIREAKNRGWRYLSFGTSTLEHGAVLNRSLALFKEGFHTDSYLNRTYTLERKMNNEY